jgi:hypothetical protein
MTSQGVHANGDERAADLAVSLTALAQRAERSRGRLSEDVATLGRLTHVAGYTLRPDGEIILFGRAGSGPALHIDDLTVALRNRYAPAGDPVYAAPPGCTIDPRAGAEDPWTLQEARILGLPNCSMAARMLRHDETTKRLGAGVVKHATIPSSFEMHRQTLVQCTARDGSERARSLVHRFWYVPSYQGSPRFAVDGSSVAIERPVGVQLLTEQEFLKNGERVGSAEATPLARQWAAHVTEALAALTWAPSMVSDFRTIELTTLFRYMNVPPEALVYWLRRHTVENVHIPRFVGGIRRTEQGELVCEHKVQETQRQNRIEVSAEQELATYRLEYRGGVTADVRIERNQLAGGQAGRVAHTVDRVMASRPGTDSFVWSFRA